MFCSGLTPSFRGNEMTFGISSGNMEMFVLPFLTVNKNILISFQLCIYDISVSVSTFIFRWRILRSGFSRSHGTRRWVGRYLAVFRLGDKYRIRTDISIKDQKTTSIYTYRNRVYIPYIKGKVYIQVCRNEKPHRA
jgi:hypothetical protein